MVIPKKRAEVAVVALITDAKGRVLLTRRTREPMAGKWHLPGGAVEFGERLEEALRREIREEIGIELGAVSRLPVAIANTVYPDVDRHVVALYFRADIKDGAPRPGDATDAVGYFSERLVRHCHARGLLLDSCRQALEHALGWKIL